VPSDILPILPHFFSGPASAGHPKLTHAQSVIDVIIRAMDLVTSGQASAMCTAPIHKKALQNGAGFAFPGHTEFLAHLTGVKDVVMMLASPLLRVVPVTIHIPLQDVANSLTAELVETAVRLAHNALKLDFGINSPRIAVAGLNPHAGESGAMGGQEISMIIPLLRRLRNEGLEISGPHSADTMFHETARASYDLALCMYHDQALIPLKTLDFTGGVNITLGLPFVRTSPDHGTAFDISGHDLADPQSMVAALRMAADMAQTRAIAKGLNSVKF
jgi:4-hydroxythreonine-4-phosphate dehydrogenase